MKDEDIKLSHLYWINDAHLGGDPTEHTAVQVDSIQYVNNPVTRGKDITKVTVSLPGGRTYEVQPGWLQPVGSLQQPKTPNNRAYEVGYEDGKQEAASIWAGQLGTALPAQLAVEMDPVAVGNYVYEQAKAAREYQAMAREAGERLDRVMKMIDQLANGGWKYDPKNMVPPQWQLLHIMFPGRVLEDGDTLHMKFDDGLSPRATKSPRNPGFTIPRNSTPAVVTNSSTTPPSHYLHQITERYLMCDKTLTDTELEYLKARFNLQVTVRQMRTHIDELKTHLPHPLSSAQPEKKKSTVRKFPWFSANTD